MAGSRFYDECSRSVILKIKQFRVKKEIKCSQEEDDCYAQQKDTVKKISLILTFLNTCRAF